jgi:hypothetical protein
VTFGCGAKPNGRVEIFLSDGKARHGIEMPGEHIAGVVGGSSQRGNTNGYRKWSS